MEIPSLNKDFENGVIQSKNYVKEFFNQSDKELDILEIGSSWGYFLDICKKLGHKPVGIELNKIRQNYIKNKLNINCYKRIDEVKENQLKFDKVFLFYVLEYINNPLSYLQELLSILKKNGEIIIITPNKNDVISNIWSNENYKEFIIDEHVVNYFSVNSFLVIKDIFKESNFEIVDKQGYSFFNHLKWYFTDKPSTTGLVGGDNFPLNIKKKLLCNNEKSKEEELISQEIGDLIQETDKKYKDIIEKYKMGNQIIIKIRKKSF